ncbi:MAG: hypothetical protein J6W28_02440 [Clostridia bacterium]|nr:hypothetical protein [Clostridia bacterium]
MLENSLRELKKEGERQKAMSLFTLSELSFALFEETKSSLLNDGALRLPLLGATFEGDKDLPTAYEPLMRESAEDERSETLSALAVFLAKRLREADKDFSPWRETAPRGGRICYLPSARAEAAYVACAKERTDASVAPVDNAELGMAALAAGDADYLLLPYVTASGARLSSTEKLVAQYDLYTAAVVQMGDAEGKYGLFSLHNAPFLEKERMYLSLRYTASSYPHMGRMLTAFSAFGFAVSELSTAEDYGRVACRSVLEEKGDLLALWLYLCLYAGGFSFTGRFPVLQTEG